MEEEGGSQSRCLTCWLFHPLLRCARENVSVHVPFLTPVQGRQSSAGLSLQTIQCFQHPKKKGRCYLDGHWNCSFPVGPFQPPSQQHLHQCLMSRFLRREAAGGFQDGGRWAGHPLCFISVDILNRCLHPHEPTAAMQLKPTSLLHLLCSAWASQKLPQKGCNTERQVTHSVQTS